MTSRLCHAQYGQIRSSLALFFICHLEESFSVDKKSLDSRQQNLILGGLFRNHKLSTHVFEDSMPNYPVRLVHMLSGFAFSVFFRKVMYTQAACQAIAQD
jgi:hypothetical protein